jgi:MFS family permease
VTPATGEGFSPRYAWYVVAVLTLASISGNIDRMILSLLVPAIERDLNISDTQMSYLIGLAFSVFYTVLGLPIARLADRANRRNIMAAGVGLWSLFTTACATATTYGRLLLLRIGVGVGEATLLAPSVSLIADYFPRETRGRAMSVFSSAIFFGSGLAYLLGGWVVGFAEQQGTRTVPVLGAIRAWQSVFLFVGLPGLAVMLLFFTIREPRRESSGAGQTSVPLRAVWQYVRDNRRTFVTQNLGFAISATVNYAIAAWLATFLIRSYGWTPTRAGLVQGSLTMTVGVAAAIIGGWLADRLVKRGMSDGPLRVGMIGAAGMLISATAYPLMPTAALAVTWLVAVNFFAALPWGAAATAAAEIVPGPIRAQGVALYFFVVGLVSSALGPSLVAWCTDFVFHDRAMVRYSLALVNFVGMASALILLGLGLPAYRKTLAVRDSWSSRPALRAG